MGKRSRATSVTQAKRLHPFKRRKGGVFHREEESSQDDTQDEMDDGPEVIGDFLNKDLEEQLAKYPLACPVCNSIFKTPGGTLSHLRMSNCSWWQEERAIIADRSKQKAKGRMADSASSSDYVLVPELYADGQPFSDNVVPPWEILENMEEEMTFDIIPGALPVRTMPIRDPGASSSSSLPAPKESHTARHLHPPLALDDTEDVRHVEENTQEHGTITSYNQDMVNRWNTLYNLPRTDRDLAGEQDHKENPYFPFSCDLDWKVANWFISEDIGHSCFDRFLAIPGVVEKLGLSFKNVRGIHQQVDSLPHRAGEWQAKVLRFEDQTLDQYIIRYRDPIEAIKSLWKDPSLVEDLVYRPKRTFTNSSKETRIYSEMWTGNWWFEIQKNLPAHATVCPVIVATDKTQLTQFSGSKAAYPIYLTIGNIPKAIRRKPSRHACILLGYLSTDKVSKTRLTKTQVKTRTQRLFHESLKIIFEPFVEAGKQGVEMTNAKGEVRHVFPYLASYVADYPEQCLISCTKSGTCPKCRCSHTELQNLKTCPPRTPQWTQNIILEAQAQTKNAYQFHEFCQKREVGGGVTDPFWQGLPFTDIHQSITPDILHQLYQGVLKMLVEWCQMGMTEKEFDRRVQCLPPCYGVRHFDKGISNLSQVTGPERKQIARILLAVCQGGIVKPALTATRHLLDFIHIAQYKAHDEETLGYLSRALKGFHDNRHGFKSMKARTHFNIPKFHSMLHYVDSIRLYGATDNYNTETFERLHIDFAKDAWRSTNKRDELPQMIDWLSRHEKMRIFSTIMANNLGVSSSKPAPLTSIFLAKECHATTTIHQIELQHRAPGFANSLRALLNNIAPPDLRVTPKNQLKYKILPFDRIPLWYSYRMTRLPLGDDDSEDHLKDQIRAMPANVFGSYGRFDTVVVLTDVVGESTGLEGTKIGRIKVIFKLPEKIRFPNGVEYPTPPIWPKGPLAYVEWYKRSKDTDDSTLFYTVQQPLPPEPIPGEVVHLSQIRQTCMLSPKFGHPSWDDLTGVDTDSVLNFPGRPYILNHFSSPYAYQSIW